MLGSSEQTASSRSSRWKLLPSQLTSRLLGWSLGWQCSVKPWLTRPTLASMVPPLVIQPRPAGTITGVGVGVIVGVGVAVSVGVDVLVGVLVGVRVGVGVIVGVGVAVGVGVDVLVGVLVGVRVGVGVTVGVGVSVRVGVGVSVGVLVGVRVGVGTPSSGPPVPQLTISVSTFGMVIKLKVSLNWAPLVPAIGAPSGKIFTSVLVLSTEQVNESSTKLPV